MNVNDKPETVLPEACAEALETLAYGKRLLAQAEGLDSTHRRLEMTRIAIDQALDACKGLPPEAKLKRDARENRQRLEDVEEKMLMPLPTPRVRRYTKGADLS